MRMGLLKLAVRWSLALLYSFAIFFALFASTGCNPLDPEDHKWPNTKWYFFWSPGDSVDRYWPIAYQPEQPIPFSHKKHAGDMKMPCEYCHSAARKGPSAGIPGTNTCMGCHKYTATDKEAIKMLTAHYDKNEPVEWTKVHDLPDYARFTHKPHVAAGVDCVECHSDVANMEEVYQGAPLQMGWCLRCHVHNQDPENHGRLVKCYNCHY